MRLVGMGLSTREEEPGSFTVEQWGTAGEPMRFEDFYLSQLPSTVALARALSPAAVAEDIAQEAMLAAFRRWAEVRDFGRPEAWVRRTCANMAVSGFRRRMAEVRAMGRSHTTPPQLADPDDEAFWELVRALPRRQAQSVALHYLFDLSVADVAATLGIAEGSVKVHLSRARQTLAARLSGQEEWS